MPCKELKMDYSTRVNIPSELGNAIEKSPMHDGPTHLLFCAAPWFVASTPWAQSRWVAITNTYQNFESSNLRHLEGVTDNLHLNKNHLKGQTSSQNLQKTVLELLQFDKWILQVLERCSIRCNACKPKKQNWGNRTEGIELNFLQTRSFPSSILVFGWTTEKQHQCLIKLSSYYSNLSGRSTTNW